MKKTIISIKKMDCPSEIKQIESLFDGVDEVYQINFDLGQREVTFFHTCEPKLISERLEAINLNGPIVNSMPIKANEIEIDDNKIEGKTLKILLLINFILFIFEFSMGLFSDSTGLIADSIDMLADALVYGISLYAVGKAAKMKVNAAYASGIFQFALATGCLFEVVRRFIVGSEPLSSVMIAVSIVALLGNVFCLFLIHKHKDRGIHMKASWIFSANDVIVNIGVILAGGIVAITGSAYPDLIIGTIISLVVFVGAIRILKLVQMQKK